MTPEEAISKIKNMSPDVEAALGIESQLYQKIINYVKNEEITVPV